ncbi:MAG: preprotein translocase subunit SecE [Paludibacteraceae bacterium]|nr:preprotein translocase subunit SecE [Bacteroidales bacterium]MBO5132175.1 preprotein translocase subunit SecE [Paludibacteraceae bacterium]MBO5828142.1 preprotein translocase subunit SecE [Paludibacteraceae bacterium]MBQ9100015.1 preprotein translocase subunit SecE [Paludibacteraceae bacterium]MEE0912128.1 preprotein translocase subunit SecE [Paludibacteraceae bacterium]
MMKVLTYIKDSYDELVNKVSWPSSKELSNSAVVVLVASLLIALVIFGMDKAIEELMKFIYNLLS